MTGASTARNWRRLRIGEASLPLRGVLAAIGVVVWLVTVVLLTGLQEASAALAANAAFVGGLFVIGSVVRTVGVLTVVRALLLGALAMAVMLFVGQPLAGLSRDPAATVDPIAEELLKLTPLALLLWQGRRVASWQLGATDVALIAVASGAGFAIVEDAYIRMNVGWGDTVPLLPTTEIYEDRIRGDRLIAGHAVWTALSGMTIGITWLMVRFRAAMLLAPLGLLVATVDHIGVNTRSLPALGPIVIILFLTGLAAVVALDLYVLRHRLPSAPGLDEALSRPAPAFMRWRRSLDSRRLRYAAWRLARVPTVPGQSMARAELAVRASVVKLVDWP